MKIHCDKCEREVPPLEEAREQGWYMSANLSVSGIPMDLVCPECLAFRPEKITRKPIDFNEIDRLP